MLTDPFGDSFIGRSRENNLYVYKRRLDRKWIGDFEMKTTYIKALSKERNTEKSIKSFK